MTLVLVAAVVSGLLTAGVFRLTTNMAALRSTVRQIQGNFLEFRLFFDEPLLIWRAQRALIVANLRLLKIVLPSMLILALPMAWLFGQLDKAPLAAGEATVVTAQLDGSPEEITLEAPPGIEIETPPVRVTAAHQVAWRVRPIHAVLDPRFKASPASHVLWLKVDSPHASRWWVVWFLSVSSLTTLIAARSGMYGSLQYKFGKM